MGDAAKRPEFNSSAGLGRFFRYFRQRPLAALRLLAIDAFVLGGLGLAFGFAQMRETGPLTIAALIVGVFIWFGYHLSSHAAWLRFLMGREHPGLIPHRFGKDERRILGLYVIALIVAGLALLPFGLLLTILRAAGRADLTALLMICAAVVAGIYYVRFLPLAPLVILSSDFRPFIIWSFTKRIWGGLFWAGLTALLFYAAAVILVGVVSAGLGYSFAYTGGQFDMGLTEMSREAFRGFIKAELGADRIALLLAVLGLRIVWVGLLRGIAAEAALAIHAAGSEGAEAEPATPPSSASGRGPGHAPEPV